MHPALEAAQAKIDRAYEHFEALHFAVEAFLDPKPYGIAIEFDPDTEWWIAKAKVAEQPPPLLSILAGEVGYTCISALNHLVWELASRKLGRRRVWSVKNQVQFPVTVSDSHFSKQALVHHRLVSKKALALIRLLQPYSGWHGFPGPRGHPLRAIKDLADTDKHRTLVATFTRFNLAGIEWTWDTDRALGVMTEDLPLKWVEDGVPLAKICFAVGNSEANVGVHPEPTFDISFRAERAEFAREALFGCLYWVNAATVKLATLFDSPEDKAHMEALWRAREYPR